MSENTSEEWRAVVGYEGLYEVSDQGRVRSLDRVTAHGHSRKGRMMVLGEHNRDGYHTVSLSAGKGKTQWFVQRLVAYSFHGNPPRESLTLCIGTETPEITPQGTYDGVAARITNRIRLGTAGTPT